MQRILSPDELWDGINKHVYRYLFLTETVGMSVKEKSVWYSEHTPSLCPFCDSSPHLHCAYCYARDVCNEYLFTDSVLAQLLALEFYHDYAEKYDLHGGWET